MKNDGEDNMVAAYQHSLNLSGGFENRWAEASCVLLLQFLPSIKWKKENLTEKTVCFFCWKWNAQVWGKRAQKSNVF